MKLPCSTGNSNFGKTFLTKNISSIIVATCALFFISCGEGKGDSTTSKDSAVTKTETAQFDHSLPKGQLKDSIVMQNGQSYALYLPSYYTEEKKWPCIFFFDPHARGAMPLSMYKTLAERYGFILAGSNVSKNGMQGDATRDAGKAMIADARTRLNIEPQRIYTAGFSGGSRVASALAVADGGIAGVIGCGAGVPGTGKELAGKFDYFGIVGVYDFNQADMLQMDMLLQQGNYTHCVLNFKGIHQWAPVAEMETALLWMQVNAMKEKTMLRNDSLVNMLKQDLEHRAGEAQASGDVLEQFKLRTCSANILEGLQNPNPIRREIAALVATDTYKKAVESWAQSQQKEQEMQQQLAKDFAMQKEQWWSAKIKELRSSGKDLYQKQMYTRLISFLGLVGYMDASRAINMGDQANANRFLAIFKMADPSNPDVPYLQAQNCVKAGDNKRAFASLSEAAKMGYSDIVQLETEPIFSSLSKDPEYSKIAQSVRSNVLTAKR